MALSALISRCRIPDASLLRLSIMQTDAGLFDEAEVTPSLELIPGDLTDGSGEKACSCVLVSAI